VLVNQPGGQPVGSLTARSLARLSNCGFATALPRPPVPSIPRVWIVAIHQRKTSRHLLTLGSCWTMQDPSIRTDDPRRNTTSAAHDPR
jgi:hypothetical protein